MPGFFGKLPGSGDFLARGLASGLRNHLDGWLTRHIADHAATPERWPEGGLRGLIDAPETALLVVIGPSIDRSGRSFPILACEPVAPISRAACDRWANLAAVALSRAVKGEYDADTLLAALQTIPAPADDGLTPLQPSVLWSEDEQGVPSDVIAAIFDD